MNPSRQAEPFPPAISYPTIPTRFLMRQKPGRDRLDRTLVSRGLAESREQAARLILSGNVRVDGIPADKQARLVCREAKIDVVGKAEPYVSRGGRKLEAALEAFHIDPRGLIAMDVGASTGGFTDCLLQRGAQRVYAVDVGYGQLDWRIRQDPHVVVLDRQNIRYLPASSVPDPIDLAVIDVSFISLALVLPAVLLFLRRPAWVVALIKPQFEVGRGQVGRGGIVRDDTQRQAVSERIVACAQQHGFVSLGLVDSPVHGQKGNREILSGWRWSTINRSGRDGEVEIFEETT
ncbi:MAG TPA: TlyA family RNA methyltransferase [Nitrospiraceae bacterium]|nr:TlyA family RNA methyltransferase [Nitrospiraceae bacterium]